MTNHAIFRIKFYFAILALFFLEIMMAWPSGRFYARPELILVAVIFFGLHFGAKLGGEAGLIGGIFKDAFSTDVFGYNLISLFIAGLFCGYLREKLFKENFVTQFLVSAFFAYLMAAIYFKFFYAGGILPEIDREFWDIAFKKSLYTGLSAPFLFFIFARIFYSEKSTI